MKNKFLSIAIFASLIFSSTVLHAQTRYTEYVNPFIGCAANGHTFPGACVPFGLVQTSPVTGTGNWGYCSEYMYTDTEIWGFSQMHLNGTGCPDLGEVLLMPSTARSNRTNYCSSFKKENEKASPGYYSVYLDDTHVKAELTATSHVAFHRYTFNATDSAAIYIDLQHASTSSLKQYASHVNACEVNWETPTLLTGHINTSVWVTKDVYFAINFDKPFKRLQNLPLKKTEKGNKMLVFFDLKPGEQIQAKIAISSTSIKGALHNLEAELPGWNFDETCKQADEYWESYLSRIEVEGTKDEKVNFYTSFYHALIQPNNIADAGEEEEYSTFSCWDTYRAAHPFYTIIVPEKVDGFVNSLIRQGERYGFLPIWGLWGMDNYCMIGNHAVPIIAEAYHKGFRGFDAERAFNIIKQTQTVPHKPKSNWDNYTKYGYFPTDLTRNESVSSTLECVYDDYAAADMARLMGKKEDAAYFADRANYYKNVFDSETRFMRPRKSDGTWKSPFSPGQLNHEVATGGDYTEGNAWQYTWHVQHDVPGLIKLMGGKEAFTNKLDSLFTTKPEGTLSDVTGLIGQYAHGNEPSHHVTYLYTLAGKPERTQELIREIFNTQYKPEPDGLCGNDDCGQMSAWYMLSAMGFYPVDPVSAQYVFGAPQMPRITLHLNNGKTFTVTAEGISKEKFRVAKIYLNGKPYKKNYINHSDIIKGGTLRFVMK